MRFTGLTLQGNYTYGKAIDDTDGETGSTSWQDAWNRKAERALAGFDVRQRVNIAGLWDTPFFKERGHFALAHYVLGGWQLSGVTILDSGTPVTVTNSAAFRLTRRVRSTSAATTTPITRVATVPTPRSPPYRPPDLHGSSP
jgi:hypothetical protein